MQFFAFYFWEDFNKKILLLQINLNISMFYYKLGLTIIPPSAKVMETETSKMFISELG